MDYTKPVSEPMVALHGSIVADYAEFSDQDTYTVFEKMNAFQLLNTADFAACGNVHKFYAESDTYIYDLLTAHADLGGVTNKLNKFIRGFMEHIHNFPGKKFLEFGGGIGDFCEIMATWGEKDVTYMDIQSHVTDFAQWRFAKYNVPVKVQIISQEDFELMDTYDIIFQDAVLEHLPPAKQLSYTRKLCQAVQPNGLFIMIVDLSGENPDMPMHYNVDINLVHDVIRECGFENNCGIGQFASVWTRVK